MGDDYTADFAELVEEVRGSSFHIDYNVETKSWHKTSNVPFVNREPKE